MAFRVKCAWNSQDFGGDYEASAREALLLSNLVGIWIRHLALLDKEDLVRFAMNHKLMPGNLTREDALIAIVQKLCGDPSQQ